MTSNGKALLTTVGVIVLCWLGPDDLWALNGGCEQAVSSAEMQTCANRRYEAADAELNRVYKRLVPQLPAQRREQLKAAQHAWIGFRDKNAAFVASAAAGGTLYPILEVSEMAAMTEHRTEQLKALLTE